MKVTIITATFNSSKTIQDTILSLESQTYNNIEYIIVDGNSKDNTLEIINEYSTRVSTVICEPDKGIYDALNKGISAATGDVIGFLHSDDILAYPDAITDIVSKFSEGNFDAVYADLEYVSQDNTNLVVRKWKSGDYNVSKLKYGWMPPHPSFYMKRSRYIEWGVFNLNYKISADYDSLLRYLWVHKAKAVYLPRVLTKMRVGGISNRSLKNIIQKSREDVNVIKMNGLFWPIALLFKNLSKLPQFIK
ncbi:MULTISPECIES: glycosyltransferase family 2 protein [Rahnella]|uniref:glycosyltransferase family 2 protein n=1 Tax=Rahnella TaxID=34037 RepID=UPI001C265606|nr:glycosyltransferase family 2 protein [Rahnella rivi]MBU9830795.1 glycosyltransferase [Rahnella rivi]